MFLYILDFHALYMTQKPQETQRQESISPLRKVYTHVLCLDQCSGWKGPRGRRNISPLCTVNTHVLCLNQCSGRKGPRGRRTALHYVQCTLMYYVQISVVAGKDGEDGEHLSIVYSVHACTMFRSVQWPERTERTENISPLCTMYAHVLCFDQCSDLRGPRGRRT